MQDFTGVPAVVDLASMRDAIVELGGAHNIKVELEVTIGLIPGGFIIDCVANSINRSKIFKHRFCAHTIRKKKTIRMAQIFFFSRF